MAGSRPRSDRENVPHPHRKAVRLVAWDSPSEDITHRPRRSAGPSPDERPARRHRWTKLDHGAVLKTPPTKTRITIRIDISSCSSRRASRLHNQEETTLTHPCGLAVAVLTSSPVGTRNGPERVVVVLPTGIWPAPGTAGCIGVIPELRKVLAFVCDRGR